MSRDKINALFGLRILNVQYKAILGYLRADGKLKSVCRVPLANVDFTIILLLKISLFFVVKKLNYRVALMFIRFEFFFSVQEKDC